MVNVPYRSSDAFLAQRISVRLSAMRRTAGAILLAMLAALLLGALLQKASIEGGALNDLVPLDDPAVAALFTA
jgi:hypothetical protein